MILIKYIVLPFLYILHNESPAVHVCWHCLKSHATKFKDIIYIYKPKDPRVGL